MAMTAKFEEVVTTGQSVYRASTLQLTGTFVMRYGLALTLAWIGAMKFTAYEAQAIQPLVTNSPLMSWVYNIFSVRTYSTLLGIVEIGAAVLIAVQPLSAKLAAIGSGLATLIFLGTLSFLFSTPGWEASLGGFPALSVVPGQFLVKDLVLLGTSLWMLGESLAQATHDRV